MCSQSWPQKWYVVLTGEHNETINNDDENPTSDYLVPFFKPGEIQTQACNYRSVILLSA